MQGTVVERRTFDAFGKPRTERLHDTQTSSEVLLNILNSEYSNRGFTDHEHFDDAQLIHMNGRAYDYNLGRFLSVDPFIQDPGNSQSMNPYSYIMNNPLAGTDPSGYRAKRLIDRPHSPMFLNDIFGTGGDLVNEIDNGSKPRIISICFGSCPTPETLKKSDDAKQMGENTDPILGGAQGGNLGDLTGTDDKVMADGSLDSSGSKSPRGKIPWWATIGDTRGERQVLLNIAERDYDYISREEYDANAKAMGSGVAFAVLILTPGPDDVALSIFLVSRLGQSLAKLGSESLTLFRVTNGGVLDAANYA
ncbi:MAG: RHS repeat-associated core domain-containing protein [Gammaproteobacteria bacterium]|nr:RHS repeat-associated core domain-containing protein [Gammaproteobacteria bacterium]